MKGIYRITFEGSNDVLIINSDTRRSNYWKAVEGRHFSSLHLAYQTQITRCETGESLGILARSYGGALPSGTVAMVESSYHPLYAPDSPVLFGPNVDYKPLTANEIESFEKYLSISLKEQTQP